MKTISLTQGMTALVDDDDYEFLSQWKWHVSKNHNTYYARRGDYSCGRYTTIFMHRVIMKTPQGLETDHIDHNGLNNQKYNLRIVTRQQNKLNVKAHGKSKYLGVSVRKQGKYEYIHARINHNGEYIYLGSFPTEETAALAYNKAALQYHGEYANLNKLY